MLDPSGFFKDNKTKVNTTVNMPKDNSMEAKTHFGYEEVPESIKSKKVGHVFDSVASKYDVMNDVMSFGIHRLWKQFTIAQARVRSGHLILDIAAGTGDLVKAFAKLVGKNGHVICSDINAAMLKVGRRRLIDIGLYENISYTQLDAECLPFQDNSFDRVSIAFGLRNVTHIPKALQSMQRVLKPGGMCLILEFSTPTMPLLKPVYDAYSFNLLPKLGEWIAGDKASYQYLAESIRMHPNQETLKNMMLEAGFDEVEVYNLSGGIVALHKGINY